MTKPCVIFDSHHPKHYLAIRQLGRRCAQHGIEVIWTARNKDVLVDLIRQDGLDPVVLTTARNGLLGKLGELATYDWKLAKLARRYRPFAMLGKSIAIAQVGRALGIYSILINDDGARQNPQFRFLGYPFASRIVTPLWLGENHGARHRTFPGFLHMTYLHPNVFVPDGNIRTELGLLPDTRIFVIRLAAFNAYHDVGDEGVPRQLLDRILNTFTAIGRVFICSEAPLTGDLAQYRLPTAASRLHHVLAASDLVLGDGLSVCIEAALLGVPAIVIGSYVPKILEGESLKVLQNKFGLMYSFTPNQCETVIAKLNELLAVRDLAQEWRRRRKAMLLECVDPTEVFWDELMNAIEKRSAIAA